MPRLTPVLLLHAYRLDALLPPLLRECRTLPSARNELRWLRERALSDTAESRRRGVAGGARAPGWRSRLRSMVRERARGKPLQYILGDQPFGFIIDRDAYVHHRPMIAHGNDASTSAALKELLEFRLCLGADVDLAHRVRTFRRAGIARGRQ